MNYNEFFDALDEYILEGFEQIKSVSCNLFNRLVVASDEHFFAIKNNLDFNVSAYEEKYAIGLNIPKMNIVQFIGLFYTFNYGRIYRMFYNFSDALFEELKKEYNIKNYNEFRNESFEVFKNLPYKSFGISYKNSKAYICIDLENNLLSISTNNYELEYNKMIIGSYAIRDTIHKTLLKFAEIGDISIYSQHFQNTKELLITCYMLMKYLCCSNKDIIDQEQQEEVSIKPKSKTKIKNTITTWNVGFRIAKFIKEKSKNEILEANKTKNQNQNIKNENQNLENKNENIKLTSKKRSHMRKAHFHHFWTGNKENKKLVVKWLSSMLINFDLESNPITEYKIK